MGRTTKISSVFLLILLRTGALEAAPVDYTFSGYIDNIGSDRGGFIAAAGLGLYSRVSYTVRIDFAASGSVTHSDGSIQYYSDNSGTFYGMGYVNDYFHAELISGHTSLPAYITNPDYTEQNLGVSVVWANGSSAGELSLVDKLFIQSQHFTVHNWVIGQPVTGLYTYGNAAAGTYGSISSRLNLVSIQPVPIPAAVWLFITGLGGLFSVLLYRKRGAQYEA